VQADDLDDLGEMLAASLERQYELLVAAFQHRLYRFALRLCGNPQDAEEITQDAFVRAYRALAQYPRERIRALALRPWLYQIALNVYRNRVRVRQLPQVPLSVLGAGEDEGAPGIVDPADDPRDGPAETAVRHERQRELARLLERLPEHFRVAVVLRHVEGLSYRELAELLAQPEGTVKAHVHRGTRLLREALAREAREVTV
jgi:RNA polymerase sigma-70 factor (ECF subfamily)